MILLRCIFLILVLSAAVCRSSESDQKVLVCKTPNTFTALSDGQPLVVYSIQLVIKYSDIVGLVYPGLHAVSLVFENGIVSFEGYLIPENFTYNTIAKKITWSEFGDIIGFANLVVTNNKYYVVSDAVIDNSPDFESSPNLTEEVISEIDILKTACLQDVVKNRVGILSSEDLKHTTGVNELGPVLVLPPATAKSKTNNSINVNGILDLILNKMRKNLQNKYRNGFPIPSLHKSFSTGLGIFKINGHFETLNGVFHDITTLNRLEDAMFANEADEYKISCSIGLSVARLQYNHYQVKYGYFSFYGNISGTVDGLGMNIRVVLDFSEEPCKLYVEHLKIIEFGEVNMNITGLSILNPLFSKLLTWVTREWEDDIIHLIENALKNIIDHELQKLSCEPFQYLRTG